MITIFCKNPTDQAQVLNYLESQLKPINSTDIVIIYDVDGISFTDISDCDGYQFTAKEYLKTDKK